MNDGLSSYLYPCPLNVETANDHMTYASIITIGDELLIGQVIDTNSAWMAQQLNKAGITVKRRVAVGDTRTDIWNALEEQSLHADIVLITGGLGPTADDITKPLLCEYFKGKLIVDKEALANVKHLFESVFKRELTERNIKQAEVPDTCKVILNKRGTAPGMWFEKGKKVYVSMPGVPYEMKGMMEEAVVPALVKQFAVTQIAYRTLMTFGIGESVIADRIQSWEESLPPHIKLAYLPNYGMVRLRLSSTGTQKERLNKELDSLFVQLQEMVKDNLVTKEDEPMETVIGKLLLERKQTIGTAESCTGGYIAHLITSVPGSSAYFEGSMVTYSYRSKEDLLQVNEQTLVDKGAVSEEVVSQMLKGLLEHLKTDFGIAVSGIMGPGGGMPDKPAGTVWMAVGNKNRTVTQKIHFRFDRQKNIQLTAMHAMNLVRKFILES